MSADVRILRLAEVPMRERGGGVRTREFVTTESDTVFTSGTTEFDPGAAVGFHTHNCAESVLVLQGEARFDYGDESTHMAAGDATFVPEGVPHRFVNTGSEPMRLHFVYGSSAPTRTMVDSGETFAIGSQQDVVS